jgi:outer membrane protein TolC
MKATKIISSLSFARVSALALWAGAMLLNTNLHAQQRKLSLSEALEQASAGNKELQIQRLEVLHQNERASEIRGRMLPSLNFNSGINHYFDRQVIFLPGSFAGTAKDVQDVAVGGLNTFSASVSLYQPIVSESVRRQHSTAAIEQNMQQEKSADYEANLRFAVTSAYFEIVVLRQELLLQEGSLERNNKELSDSKALFAQGRALKSDTLRSYIAVENTRSVISYLKSSLSVAGARLKRLMGSSEPEELVPTDELVPAEDFAAFRALQLQYLESQSLIRPDVKLQELSIRHQQSVLKSIQGEKLPQLSLVGQYQVQAQDDGLELNNYVYPQTSFLGLQLSIPLFNGKKLVHQARQVKIRIEQEELKLADLTEKAKLEIAEIFSNWEDASSQLAIQQKTIEAAKLHYNMIKDRYKNGLSSKLQLSDAEVSLTMAQLNHLKNIFEIKLLTLQLKKALGKL